MLATFLTGVLLSASALTAQVECTGMVHSPLPVERTLSLEAECAAKPVLASLPLEGIWSGRGHGQVVMDADTTVLTVTTDLGTSRATGPADDPDYATYGNGLAILQLDNVCLDGYNRLHLDIEPSCPGMRVVNVNLSFRNALGQTGEGYNIPPGAHLITLENGRKNTCYFEIEDLRRDAVSEIVLSVAVNGRDLPVASSGVYRISGVCAERVPATEKVSGWLPESGQIVYSMSGYDSRGTKTAIVEAPMAGKTFSLTDKAGERVFAGTVAQANTTIGSYGVADFSAFNVPGEYTLTIDGTTTRPFTIGGAEVWEPSCWRVLNFIFNMRCGYAVPGLHQQCHTDLFSHHAGMSIPYGGGWHDAGDLSQQTLQTADVSHSLLELADTHRQRNPVLAARLQEEALWGLQFVLRNRYGDGYHASSMGLLLWLDGKNGSHDDIHTVRVQNVAYDNFLYAAYEAYAAAHIIGDPELCRYLAKVAAEDYSFAVEKFNADGFGGWISPYEHTYCTGESLHMATALWAASMLYDLTSDVRYRIDAKRYADYVLDCQCTVPVGSTGICGFFYRTPEHRSVQHFIHQSREQLYMQSLADACRCMPDHPDCERWHNAIALYGGYLRSLMQYTAPYGMVPAGIYRLDEPADTEAFASVHLFTPSDAQEQFMAQAAKGIDLGDGFFVKRFPVWFNIFNGNLAVHTSMGKAAGICANALGDSELMDIAREQLYWIVGKNPFTQSLIYGEGHRYPSINNFSSGEITGAMPVGIRSLADSDEPYWPPTNNACYKEAWLTSAGKWLSLVAETSKNSML
ncbi:MAG: glycoside hydrolase family 9 protein [Muribaculaceae bacterium]|nr:glycoside hydrolase family 9 protein [Muribaculaceae bacterium]